MPDIPAVDEFVPGYVANVWHGVGAPKETPVEIIKKLNEEINAVLADPTIKAQFANLGAEPMPMTLTSSPVYLIADEVDKWAKVIKFANIKVD